MVITSLGAREELNQAVHAWGGITFHDVINQKFAHKAVEKGADGLVLVAAGGILYTLGGVVYGLKRPDPSPRWFGFHEVFHSFTVLAFVSHYVGVSLATYSLR